MVPVIVDVGLAGPRRSVPRGQRATVVGCGRLATTVTLLFPLVTDVTDPDVITAVVSSLRLRPDSEIMAWMTWPDLWFEFVDQQGSPLALLGWITPDWVRWEMYGDLQLLEPARLEDELTRLGVVPVMR